VFGVLAVVPGASVLDVVAGSVPQAENPTNLNHPAG